MYIQGLGVCLYLLTIKTEKRRKLFLTHSYFHYISLISRHFTLFGCLTVCLSVFLSVYCSSNSPSFFPILFIFWYFCFGTKSFQGPFLLSYFFLFVLLLFLYLFKLFCLHPVVVEKKEQVQFVCLYASFYFIFSFQFFLLFVFIVVVFYINFSKQN